MCPIITQMLAVIAASSEIRRATITTRAPFAPSRINVIKAANLFPVLRTFVAPILPEPISRRFPKPKTFVNGREIFGDSSRE